MGRLELRHVILPRLKVLLQLRERHHLGVDEVSDLLKKRKADKLEEADLRFGDVLVVYAVAKRRYRNTQLLLLVAQCPKLVGYAHRPVAVQRGRLGRMVEVRKLDRCCSDHHRSAAKAAYARKERIR